MKVWVRMIPLVVVFGLTSCSIYHMQNPQTVPPGKLAGGAALSVYVREFDPQQSLPLVGFWVRTGLSPRFDLGIHTWMLGLKIDGKYNVVKDYLSVGGLKFNLWHKLSLYAELGGMFAFEPEAGLVPDPLYTGGVGLSIGQ